MSEPTTEVAGTGTEATAEQEQPKPTETVDFWKQKAREQEKRAKDNADAAKRLAEIEEANKSDLDKAAERAAKAEQERDAARAEALRYRVATKHGISDEDAELFLTGTDEDTLTKQAERLTQRESERGKQGNRVVREGQNHATQGGDDARFARDLLSGGD